MIITSYLRYMLLQMHVRSICTLNSLACSQSIFFENIIIISMNYSYETDLSFCNIYERSYVKSVHNKRTHCIQIPISFVETRSVYCKSFIKGTVYFWDIINNCMKYWIGYLLRFSRKLNSK